MSELDSTATRFMIGTTQPTPNAEFVERCQIEYQRNPASRVFAPLAEAYRRMGLLEEAFEVAQRGVRLHPEFAAGRIALARLHIEKRQFPEAIEHLTRATELSPDNLLAFQLIGESFLELRRPKDALQAFKMVLFLSPGHERAAKMVKKWEFLTADEYEDEVFVWTKEDPEPSRPLSENSDSPTSNADREAYRAVSISDALTVRNDLEGAAKILSQALRRLGPRGDLETRLKLLAKRLGLTPEEVLRQSRAPNEDSGAKDRGPLEPSKPESPAAPAQKKRKKLERLLEKLNGPR